MRGFDPIKAPGISDCAARNCLITAPSERPALGSAVFRDLAVFGLRGARAVPLTKFVIIF